MIKHYIEFMFAGIMFTDTDSKAIKSRTEEIEIPKNCFGYRFYDIEESKSESGRTLRSGRINVTGVYYIKGTVFTLAQIKKLMPDSILRKNMENNGYNKVVKTISGTYQPVEKRDKILV